MFLIRLAFWAALIVMLLPSSHQDKQDLFVAAEKTASDFYNFCDRNPDVCVKAEAAFTQLLQKVKVGVEMIEEMMSERQEERTEAGVEQPRHTYGLSASSVVETETPSKAQNTLQAQDLDPVWSGPVQQPR